MAYREERIFPAMTQSQHGVHPLISLDLEIWPLALL